jgi:hypothetical protein
VVVGHAFVLTFQERELSLICEALWLYQANQRGFNDKQAELAGALRHVLNKATVEVYWDERRVGALGVPLPEST